MTHTLIIDGSNVVRTWLHLNGNINFAEENKFCEKFLHILQHLKESAACRIEVYFDGPKRTLARPEEIDVIFSGAKKADDLIVNSVYELTQNYGAKVCVITQDKELMERCQNYGSFIKKAWHFLHQIKQNARELI